jgi:hypothetical protein
MAYCRSQDLPRGRRNHRGTCVPHSADSAARLRLHVLRGIKLLQRALGGIQNHEDIDVLTRFVAGIGVCLWCGV